MGETRRHADDKHPLQVAGDLQRDGYVDAAKLIHDLHTLARSYLLFHEQWFDGQTVSDNVLNHIQELKHLARG